MTKIEAPLHKAPCQKTVRLAFLGNAHARYLRQDPKARAKLEKAFGQRGPFLVVEKREDLTSSLTDILHVRPEILFLCGGDGTLRLTLTKLLAIYHNTPLPQIAILRGGTMNTVATSLGIMRPPLTHLRHLLERLDRCLPHLTSHRSLLRINHEFGFIFAVGGFCNFINEYQKDKHPSPRSALRLLAKTLLSSFVRGSFASKMFPKFCAHLWRDKQPFLVGSHITTISAASIRHIGFHIKPFVGSEISVQRFALLILRESPARLFCYLPSLFRGLPLSDPSIVQLAAGEVLIKLPQAMTPMIDGDLLAPAKEFSISAGPQLNLVVE